MTTTPRTRTFAERPHGAATRSIFILLFWLLAAGSVALVHAGVDPLSRTVGAAAGVGMPVGAAFAYTRLVAKRAGISHALAVGIAWLALSIASEIALAVLRTDGRFAFLGSPDQPLLRSLLLFVWIFAPALFAQGDGNGTRSGDELASRRIGGRAYP